jgi:hypothetical protein
MSHRARGKNRSNLRCHNSLATIKGDPVNEETFNLSIRQFLRMVGVNSQRQIEQAVAKAIADGSITGTESLRAKVTLEVAGLKLHVTFDGEIQLQ